VRQKDDLAKRRTSTKMFETPTQVEQISLNKNKNSNTKSDPTSATTKSRQSQPIGLPNDLQCCTEDQPIYGYKNTITDSETNTVIA